MTGWSAVAAVAVASAVWLLTARPARERLVELATRTQVTATALPDVAVAATVVGGCVGLVLTGGAVGGVAGVSFGAAAGVAWRRRRANATAATVRRGLPDVLRLLAAELHAGASPPAALAAAALLAPDPLGAHLQAVAAGARLGVDPADALHPAPPGAEGLRSLAACWRVSADVGAGLADGVLRLATGLAAEERCRAELEAQLAGPRASAAVLAGLPALAMAMAAGLGARPLEFFRTPVGTGCLVLGITLDAAGVAWTRQLAARAGR